MKPLYSILVISLLFIEVSVAQTSRPASKQTTATSTTMTAPSATTSRPAVKPPATRPAATSAQASVQTTGVSGAAGTPNRQQELYDQYHGINKKATTPSIPGDRPTTSQTNSNATTSQSAPAQTASQSNKTNSYSQSRNPSAVRIGIRGGVTYPFYIEKVPGVKANLGFVGGITFNFGAGALSFQPEINYVRYGAKSSNNFYGDITGAQDRLEVPLLLKFSTGSYVGNRFFVNVGPYGAYITGESLNGKQYSVEGLEGRFSYGAAAGIGAAIKAGPGHATAELRGLYQLGDTANGFDANTKVVLPQLTLGYIFPLGRR